MHSPVHPCLSSADREGQQSQEIESLLREVFEICEIDVSMFDDLLSDPPEPSSTGRATPQQSPKADDGGDKGTRTVGTATVSEGTSTPQGLLPRGEVGENVASQSNISDSTATQTSDAPVAAVLGQQGMTFYMQQYNCPPNGQNPNAGRDWYDWLTMGAGIYAALATLGWLLSGALRTASSSVSREQDLEEQSVPEEIPHTGMPAYSDLVHLAVGILPILSVLLRRWGGSKPLSADV